MNLDFRLLLERSPEVRCVLSPDFRILALSDAYARVSMRERDSLIGQVIYEAFPDNPDDPGSDGVNKLRASLEQVRNEKREHRMPVVRYDIRLQEAQGGAFAERYWSPVNTPVLDDDGGLLCILHTAVDITGVVTLKRDSDAAFAQEHDRLVQSNIALEASNEELEAFCYSVAHDLRAPLRGIQGFSQALLEEYAAVVGEKGQSYLMRVSAGATRMSNLIDDLLTLSRISRATLSRSSVDLSALARAVAADVERLHGRSVRLLIADGLVANADARLLQIVFENLLGNAWKFTANTAAPQVEVGATREGEGLTCYVRDNGAGFDEAYATKLFAPFQRMHSEKDFPGTGIGLATVQRVVRRHGGRVWARAAVDRGATIFFTLPD
ncbi:MAG TPA: ATP-binding protein [Vicinamibacterales bacterium]|nr:ATP-binding protein [Vicinamibacterales bacterium]